MANEEKEKQDPQTEVLVNYTMLVPEPLYIQWKIKATKERKTMKEVVLPLLEAYLKSN